MQGLNIVVLNGSPKGPDSVTMQYMMYLEKRFPQHRFEFVHAARRSAMLERDEAAFDEVMDTVAGADLIIWAYPLYFLLVCSQYKRFIELVFERGRGDVFAGKYAAALSTSIHFFDSTALEYIHAVSDDLGMNFIDGITPKMDDLLDAEFRRNFDAMFSEWVQAVSSRQPMFPAHASSVPGSSPGRTSLTFDTETFPANSAEQTSADAMPARADRPTKVCIVGDLEDSESSVRSMAVFARGAYAALGAEVKIVDLAALKFGPCTGCLKCGFDNECAYEGKDEFIDIHRNTVLASDIVIFAGAIHDRYLSFRWQRYLERSFNRTHKLTLSGKQIGFIISGALSATGNIRTILQAYVEVNRGSICQFISDEHGEIGELAAAIRNMARTTLARAAAGFRKPDGFLGVAGRKIFRDDIFSHLRFVFQEDHAYYRKEGLYDFPQRSIRRRLLVSLGILATRIPFLRKRIRGELQAGMLNPYRRLFRELEAGAG
jgi:multimeric flavodoxin WrbA